ncbi:MAG: EamA family transporter [Myxococcaceae bacterium]
MSASTRGALCGLAAAALFGLSAPLAKPLLGTTAPLMLAGLLYLGGGLALSVASALRRHTNEAPLRRGDVPVLGLLILAGGVVGPVLMLVALQRSSASAVSLLLNLEGPFTLALAALVFSEHVGWRGVASLVAVVAGAVVLALPSGGLQLPLTGVLCAVGACLAWGLDNNLTRTLSLRDPLALVRAKTLGAGACTLALARLTGQTLPALRTLVFALVLGAASYGTSILLDAYALRLLGAAREAAYFATAPFLGALGAVVLLGEPLLASTLLAGACMAVGVWLLLSERHRHAHSHEAVAHEHRHTHDAHHQHRHAGPFTEPHSHPHQHAPLTHDHPHVPDAHHHHRH